MPRMAGEGLGRMNGNRRILYEFEGSGYRRRSSMFGKVETGGKELK